MGDIVLVHEESVARNKYPLGRITEVFVSYDGLVRSVRVKTQTGQYKRPITKLSLLESV